MGKRRILIIDDEADIRAVAQLSLEINNDWEVLTAASGKEGLEIAQQQTPDAILLDVMMPDLDGPTTWAKLQDNTQTQDIPVIFLTAKVQAAEQRRYAQLGVKAVLTKPFDPVTLGDLIEEALGS
ncbi:response regulator [Spirulina sp. CS-785/01]|uniref:response regulator n=1 Tax=Spirulina sp. CS-785/01 TaxID=3021716 RepID=UPI00232C68D9|nr:response regulator [Spirulina sp. CS-785/01]MDB9315732.1 response regulator [Spirulina sp. CS-785/01]